MEARQAMRVFGYVRASFRIEIAAPDDQKQAIEEYARRYQLQIDGWYLDRATEGGKSLADRKAGRELMLNVERGDTIVVALLVRSLFDLTKVFDSWDRLGVVLHAVDKGVFDPSNPTSRLMIRAMIDFANVKRELIRTTTNEGLMARRVEGQRVGRWPEYGWRHERRWDARRRTDVDVNVPDERERQIMRKVAEMRAEGYSIDQIRQYL
jgi:DNA invertase Pin-like site-specific DNA recombinase